MGRATTRRAMIAGLALLALWSVGAVAAEAASDYYVNRNAQDDGDHEVHRAGCRYLPLPQNRIPLGSFTDCRDAVRKARERYATADGCYHCSRSCDHG